jgi:short-subunit dehydrogenase
VAFANQVAVITGASSGIGRELARRLAADGCAVGVLARRQDRLEALAAEIRAAGGRAEYVVADVADRGQTLAAVGQLRDRLGPIDLLVANSGVGQPTEFEPPNGAVVDNMIRVNFLGVVYAIEAVLPDMLARGRGHVAAVSSLAAYKAFPGEAGYCASKSAVNAYLAGLRIQLRKRGIHVTTICPGFIETPMIANNHHPMPWKLSAEEAARRIAGALARRKKVYNFPWQTTLLVKAASWLPDWIISRVVGQHTEEKPGGALHEGARSEEK